MKITINVDCTPEEARAFMGLPDVTPINDAMVNEMKARMEKGFSPEELDSMVRTFTQSATTGVSEMQKQFWALMQQASGGGRAD